MRHALALLSIVLLASSAGASPFDDWFEVYREDFVLESVLPTSPEIDEMGAGGVSTSEEPAGLAPPPELTGTALRLFTNGIAASQQRADALPTTIGTGSLGVRGRFDGLDASVLNDPVTLTVNAAFEADAGGVFYGVGVGVRLVPDSPNPPRVFIVLGESEVDPMTFPQISSRTIEFELGEAEADLVLEGPFGLALTVNRVGSGRIYGELTDGTGQLRQGIGDLLLSDFSTQAVGRTSAGLTVESGIVVAQVDVTELGVFVPFSTQVTAAEIVDGADANPGDGFCATATGACTLRAAIQEANATPGPGKIELGEGEYVLSIPGTGEDAAATGDLDILDDLEIVGVGSLAVVQTDIDANGLDRVFHVPEIALDRVVRIRNLRIRGGFVASAQDDMGGGIATWGRTTLDRVLVGDNVASVGGGILNGRTLWLTDSIVANNLAQTLFVDGRGGGLAGGSGNAISTRNSRTTILRSAIAGNEATVAGSGVDFHRAAQADIRSSTIALNLRTGVHSFNSPLVLDHTTVESDSGAAIETVLAQGPSSIRFIQSAVTGVPACALSQFPVFQSFYEGNNASNDASCGFTMPGSIENVDLRLTPADAELLGTFALIPDPDSPLIDAGDPASDCPLVDQAGGPRPLDGDGNGSSVCDIGAIEVPEPGFGVALLSGALLLARARRRSQPDQRSGRRQALV